MKLGFIGTGALASAIVTGLKSVATHPVPVILSPRNEIIAARLAQACPDVHVATDNQAVLDACDTVMLAMRPDVALEVLPGLAFRHDHHVVSLAATLAREQVAALVAPAERVVKALPMPMIAHGQGATIIHPPDRAIAALFGPLGTVVEVDDSREFDALGVVTATFATYFKYLDTIQCWLENRNVPAGKARDYIAALFSALADAPLKSPGAGFMDLAQEYATRGGINEQVLRQLSGHQMFERFAESLDDVHHRISAP